MRYLYCSKTDRNNLKYFIMNDVVRIATYRDFIGELTATYRRTTKPTVKINSSKDIRPFIYPYFDEIMDDHEQVKIIHLNNSNNVVNVHESTTGSEVGCIVDIKAILRHALLIKTIAIVVVHNHPSGALYPSQADKTFTEKLKNAAKYLDIKVLDSMIITRESYYSFADEGLL